jgi:hypothetical protein
MKTTLTLALTLSLLGAALATPQVGRKETKTTKADVNPPVKKLLTERERVEAFFDALPKMRMDKPVDQAIPKKDPKKPDSTQGDYVTSTYTLASTPKELVSMGEVSALWLGAMLTERGVRKGGNDVTEIPIPSAMRAPLAITFSTLGIPGKTLNNPSKVEVKNVIGDLLAQGIKKRHSNGDPNTLSEAFSFEVVENQNETQTAIKLGINVRYMSGEVKSGLSMEKSSGQHTVTAAFIERAFTVSASPGIKNSAKLTDRWVTPAFTMDVAQNLKDNDFIGVDNVPCYVSGITYGRRLVFSMSSRFSASQIKFALQAAYKGVAVKAKLDVEAEKVLRDSETTIKVAGQGGPSPDKLKNLLLKGDLGAYFATAPTPGQLVPISYEIRTVTDDAPVIVLQTDKYTETQYIGNAKGRRYQITAYAKLTSRPEVTNANGEIYGEFRVNGDKVWAWDKKNSGRSEQLKKNGDIIEILSKSVSESLENKGSSAGTISPAYLMNCYEGQYPSYVFEGFIKDNDDHGSKDDYMGSFKFTLKPRAIFGDNKGKPLSGTPLAGFPEGQNWQFSTVEGKRVFTAEIPYSGKKQNGSSRLYLRIEEVGGL